MLPPAGMALDFSQPPGAPALAPANGVSWRIFSNPIALFIGGVSAVLLELAEPSVRTGVWEHSSFRRDPFGRLHRTGYAAMVTVYAPREAARAMIARVVRMHSRVQGITPEGTVYHANDPRLLTWVQATAIFGFTQAYDQFVQRLSRQEKDAAFQEGQVSGLLYGATDLPQTWDQWERLLDHTEALLVGHPILQEFVDIMVHAHILPRPMRWMQKLLVKAAIGITPDAVRTLPELQAWQPSVWELRLTRVLAWLAAHMPLPHLPPAQARKRMRKTPDGVSEKF